MSVILCESVVLQAEGLINLMVVDLCDCCENSIFLPVHSNSSIAHDAYVCVRLHVSVCVGVKKCKRVRIQTIESPLDPFCIYDSLRL